MEKQFTPEGFAKLKEELDNLKTVKQKEIAQALNYAASFGDLSENAAYHQAKEDQRATQDRVFELEHILKGAKIVAKSSGDRIGLGCFCELACADEKERFQVVSSEEASITQNKISCQSPLGKCLIGKTEGEEFDLKTENATIRYKILKVE